MAVGYLSKSQAKRYLKDLAGKFDRDFQRGCHDLLKEMWPEMRYAKDLREFDRAGIDLYLPSPRGEGLAVAVQCKGFESVNFSDRQLEQCVKSIDAFLNSKFYCDKYLLIINQPFIEDASVRKKLEVTLKRIEAQRKATTARLLDLQRFLNFLFDNLVEILLKRIQIRNGEYLEQYEKVMGSGVYVRDVPFKRNGASNGREIVKASVNPLSYVCQDIKRRLRNVKEQPGRQVQKFWTILVSEFGFGKTSLLLRLARELKELGFEALYVPIALIPPNGFDAETTFVRCLWQIVFEPTEELDIYRPNVWDVPFRHILQSRQDFVILLDGLDEHRYAYTHDGIRQIIGGLRHLTRHVVLSVRKEFWEERAGNINMAIGNADRNRQVIVLDDWNNDAIIAFLKEKQRLTKSSSLSSLLSLVTAGGYQDFYGDIPKRPLFLEMLAQDVINGEIQKTTVAELYQKYLFQKIERDITSPFSSTSSPARPLPSIHLDIYDLQRRLLVMLENVAATTVIEAEQNGPVQLLEKFPEESVSEAAKSAMLPAESILPYLMGTILVPVGKRSRDKTGLDIRFAHRSYQEYFIARYLSRSLAKRTDSDETLSELQRRYSKGVGTFLESIMKTFPTA